MSTPAVSWDADFLAGLVHTVAVDQDANASGATTGVHGGAEPDWQPVAGLESVACLLGFRRASAFERDRQPRGSRFGRALFGASIYLDTTNRLRYQDPDQPGRTIYLYVIGASMPSTGLPIHHWTVDWVEYSV